MRRSNDAILVLNAASSSIKLSVSSVRAGELALQMRRKVEGLHSAPRFMAQDPSGRVVAERSWRGTKFGHDDAIEFLTKLQISDDRLVAVGHRVVHGGLEDTPPVARAPA
jgi:acetate kinase